LIINSCFLTSWSSIHANKKIYFLIINSRFLLLDHQFVFSASWSSIRAFYFLIIHSCFLILDHLFVLSNFLIINSCFLLFDHQFVLSTSWSSIRAFYYLIINSCFLLLDHQFVLSNFDNSSLMGYYDVLELDAQFWWLGTD